jgi:hypothetical protein
MWNRQYLIAFGLLLITATVVICIGKFEDYISLLVGVSATMFGVILALDLNKLKELRTDKEEFDSGLEVLDVELEHNLSILGKHRTETTSNSFNYGRLNTSLINYFLDKPTTVRRGGKVLRQALLSCRARVDSYMLTYSRFEKYASERNGLPDTALGQLKDLISQTEFIIILLRTLITKYQNNPRSLLDAKIYQHYGSALELEKKYRAIDITSAYEKLKDEVSL